MANNNGIYITDRNPDTHDRQITNPPGRGLAANKRAT